MAFFAKKSLSQDLEYMKDACAHDISVNFDNIDLNFGRKILRLFENIVRATFSNRKWQIYYKL